MEFVGIIIGAAVVVFILGLAAEQVRGTRADKESRGAGQFAVDLERMTGSRPAPPWWNTRRIIRLLLGFRKLDSYEFSVDVRTAEETMEVVCYVPRRVLHIDVFFEPPAAPEIKNVQFHFEDGSIGDWFNRKVKYVGGRQRNRLYPPAFKAVSKVILTIEKTDQDFSYMVKVRASRDQNTDREIVREALEYIEQRRYAGALKTLEEYLEYSARNPRAYFTMADLCLKLQKYAEFEKYILKSIVYGGGQAAGEQYYRFMVDHWASDPADILEVRDECRQWSLDQHHGLIALEFDQDFELGLNHHYLKKTREIIEVSRPLAARIFTRTGFNFTDKEWLIFTACRIIKEDGTIIPLPQERFVVADSEQRNIYIAVEQSKTGSWILPDLAPGDIVEVTHYLMCQESFMANDRRIPLSIVTTAHDQSLPTYRGRVRIRTPRAYPLRCSLRDPKNAIRMTEADEGEYRTVSLDIDRYVPVKNTNADFEAYLYNPVIAFTTDEKGWPEITESLLAFNFGSLDFDGELPEPLQDIVADYASPQEALSKVFYWTRDKLKYAAVDSAMRQIGQPDRAAAIVKSGVADCKNKSYLLYLAGKKLGLDIQLVAVSSQHGIVFADLASDQFDHVFVRVRLNDRWYYLDAANRFAVFDSCPPLYQGMDMLVLTNGGKPETIRIAPPEDSRIVITETFDEISQGWLTGSFHLEARGNIARLIDEHWKAQSMQARDSLQAAQAVIQHFMPASVLQSFDRLSHTSHTDVFEVVGMIRRCQLSTVGKHLVGTLEWNDPTIPVGAWRSLRTDQAFSFRQPSMMEMRTIFAGNLPARMAEYSDPFSMDNELCGISSGADRRDGNIVICRRVEVKEKFVRNELLNLVPSVMEGIEKTFQMAIILEKRQIYEAA